MSKVTPFLMFNDQLEAAIAFYTATFPDSEVRNIARTGEDGPVTSAEFVVGGQVFMGYNGGPYFAFSEGFSLFVDCEDQAEVDRYWDALVNAGATPTACGWIKDPFGLSWQIVPRRFMELIRDRDATKVKAVMAAMMTMAKLDVAELERAYEAAPVSHSDRTSFAIRYAAAWSGKDPVAFGAFYEENGSLVVNGSPSVGRPAIVATARAYMEAFPDMTVRLESLHEEEGTTVFHWIWTGTNTGPGGTGRSVRLSGHERWTFGSSGLILTSEGHFDAAEYQRQLTGTIAR
ncbi:hypothetical protein TBR22_A16210 [Luteitalea sp. TBR-22]|uniref:VOC family protein n=1 Tax=Luteitalea sp. TBR-22 TaxID=2802971 RepID=UPI001AFA94B2|nr:VOC family protein [Luteitalea sp. TBR-22]BCS32407.1 hypothetical protein TBR22_A16210 [Luteitalea sp. TBR-22]